MMGHPYFIWDFSQLWIAVLILGAGVAVFMWLSRRKK